MADITKCQDESCPFRDTCYRFTIESNKYRQSYFKTSPYNPYNLDCEFYIPNNLVNKKLINKVKDAKPDK